MSIAWERSLVRKNRFWARIAGKKIVLELVDREWLLTEEKVRMAGVRKSAPQAERLLRDIADEHYTNGKDWRAALASAEFKLFQEQAAKEKAKL